MRRIEEIKKLLNSGRFNLKTVANESGVSYSAINDIRKGRRMENVRVSTVEKLDSYFNWITEL